MRLETVVGKQKNMASRTAARRRSCSGDRVPPHDQVRIAKTHRVLLVWCVPCDVWPVQHHAMLAVEPGKHAWPWAGYVQHWQTWRACATIGHTRRGSDGVCGTKLYERPRASLSRSMPAGA